MTTITEACKNAAKVTCAERGNDTRMSSAALCKDELNDTIVLEREIRLDSADAVPQQTANEKVRIER